MKFIWSLAVLAALVGHVSAQTPAAAPASGRVAVYNIAHYDVLPMAMGQVDFLKSGYALLFRYRDQSLADRGLQSFRILSMVPPTPNHSEIVQSWDSYEDYLNHLTQAHTLAFRFDVQNSANLGGMCCIGSPVDDRQYRLVQSFGTPWPVAADAKSVGAAGPLFVISYVEFQPQANVEAGQAQLVQFGASARQANASSLLSYNVLRQLDRPNRFAVLEIWDSQRDYKTWQTGLATRTFLAGLRPILASPVDHRLTVQCGSTFLASVGCTSP